jgi:DNA polymerase-3 subunit gamma/tau
VASIDEGVIQDVLGLAQRRVLYELSAAIIAGDAQRCLDLVAQVVHSGRDLNRLSRDLVEHFRNLLVARLAGQRGREASAKAAGSPAAEQLLDLPDQEIADLGEQMQSVTVETLLDYFDFMAAGDEDVARSATPRFALESVLVRLAMLPKTLPVGELVERLERLESKFLGTAKPASAVARVPQAPAAIPLSPQSALAMPAVPVGRRSDIVSESEPAGVWRTFISFVGREQKFLASHLESATALEMPPGTLKIGVKERLHLSFLQDSDNLSALKELAKRFFTDDVVVQITQIAAAGASEPADENRPASARTSEEGSDMVKEALRIFGGSIRNVRRENG